MSAQNNGAQILLENGTDITIRSTNVVTGETTVGNTFDVTNVGGVSPALWLKLF